MYEQVVPRRVYEHLLTGFVVHEANWLLNGLIDGGYRPGQVVLVGHPFGRVLAWMWEESRDDVGLFVADYMAQLRHHDKLVGEGCPRVRFDDLLKSLKFAMPNGFKDTKALVEYLRAHVPGFFGSNDLNS